MKSQALLTVWCNISGGAGGEIWHWSLSGVKGLKCLCVLQAPQNKAIAVPLCQMWLMRYVNTSLGHWSIAHPGHKGNSFSQSSWHVCLCQSLNRPTKLWGFSKSEIEEHFESWVNLHVVFGMCYMQKTKRWNNISTWNNAPIIWYSYFSPFHDYFVLWTGRGQWEYIKSLQKK